MTRFRFRWQRRAFLSGFSTNHRFPVSSIVSDPIIIRNTLEAIINSAQIRRWRVFSYLFGNSEQWLLRRIDGLTLGQSLLLHLLFLYLLCLLASIPIHSFIFFYPGTRRGRRERLRTLSLRIKNILSLSATIFAFYGNFREGFFALTFSFVYSTAARSSELLRKLYSEVMNPICNNCEMLVIALVLIFHSTSSTTALTLKYFRFFHVSSDFERTHTRSKPTAWCWAPNLGVHANLWIWSDYQSSKLIKDAFDSWRVAKSPSTSCTLTLSAALTVGR